MSKFYTITFSLLCLNVFAQSAPEVPEYGKLLLLEQRDFKRHWEVGIDGGVALDNTSQDVYTLSGLGNYLFSPLFSAGFEFSFNHTRDKKVLRDIEKAGNVEITNYTPDWFSQATFRIHIIKGHSNILNMWHSPFEMALILGGGVGYNDEKNKTSSLASWGGELQLPIQETYKGTIGIRHYKSYPFQKEELSFTSLLVGIRKSL